MPRPNSMTARESPPNAGCRSRMCRPSPSRLTWNRAKIVRVPRFYLTTAIDYVNSRPHLGTAYEKITADVIARYKRLCGLDTHFVMGNDEHSQNVYRRARDLGLDPLAYCDQMEQQFRDVWQKLEIAFDDFTRTSEPRHRVGVER